LGFYKNIWEIEIRFKKLALTTYILETILLWKSAEYPEDWQQYLGYLRNMLKIIEIFRTFGKISWSAFSGIQLLSLCGQI
jgi:hypothetical protein